MSHKKEVDQAFSNPLNGIEGPPGIGKIQTILNIIANAVMNNQSVAGNHARERMNRRQIDVITQEIIPPQQLENIPFGIFTPYEIRQLLYKIFSRKQISLQIPLINFRVAKKMSSLFPP